MYYLQIITNLSFSTHKTALSVDIVYQQIMQNVLFSNRHFCSKHICTGRAKKT